jgi:hypothetical protein
MADAPSSAAYRPAMNPWVIAITVTLATFVERAKAQLFHLIQKQASFLSFLDCFWMLGCAYLIGAPLVFLTRKFRSGSAGGAH